MCYNLQLTCGYFCLILEASKDLHTSGNVCFTESENDFDVKPPYAEDFTCGEMQSVSRQTPSTCEC